MLLKTVKHCYASKDCMKIIQKMRNVTWKALLRCWRTRRPVLEETYSGCLSWEDIFNYYFSDASILLGTVTTMNNRIRIVKFQFKKYNFWLKLSKLSVKLEKMSTNWQCKVRLAALCDVMELSLGLNLLCNFLTTKG